MKFSTAALACSAFFFSVAAGADSYKVDPVHTSVVFKINHMGFSNVMGVVNDVEGKFNFDTAKPEKSSFELSAKAENVNTFNKKRDEHLHSPDFFNVKQFPTISFKSKSVKKVDANHFEVAGELTLHGVTKPLNFTFTHFNTGKDPMGATRTGGETSFKIKRSDFNMGFMSGPGKVGDEVEMMINVEGTKI